MILTLFSILIFNMLLFIIWHINFFNSKFILFFYSFTKAFLPFNQISYFFLAFIYLRRLILLL